MCDQSTICGSIHNMWIRLLMINQQFTLCESIHYLWIQYIDHLATVDTFKSVMAIPPLHSCTIPGLCLRINTKSMDQSTIFRSIHNPLINLQAVDQSSRCGSNQNMWINPQYVDHSTIHRSIQNMWIRLQS